MALFVVADRLAYERRRLIQLTPSSAQEAAAHAYDRAAMVYRGPFAVTNFPVTNYLGEAAATFQATGSLPEGFGIVRGSSRAVGSAAPAAEPRQVMVDCG